MFIKCHYIFLLLNVILNVTAYFYFTHDLPIGSKYVNEFSSYFQLETSNKTHILGARYLLFDSLYVN